MKYIPSSIGVGELRGSAGNNTASRNAFGPYIRTRVQPVNPNTASQAAQRTSLTNRASEWRALTETQRAAWKNLGAAMTRLDPLGQTYTLSGFQAYCSVNRNLVFIGSATVSDAPALALPAAPVSMTVTATA